MRRPAPLLAAPHARLVAYAALAGVGALQWARYVEGASSSRALVWVATGLLAGVLVAASARLPRRWARPGAVAAAAAGLMLAVAASGLDLRLLGPRNWDELGDGLLRGLQALSSVRLPYLGRDPWVLTVVELSGALLCWGAAVAAAWPRPAGGPRIGALVLLLVLAAAPVVSMGVARPVWLGLALAVLTAAFLFGERLSRRPGTGLAVLGLAVLAVAVPLGTAADREEPWFDYKSFSQRFAAGEPIGFDWNHGYGPIDWPREGAEIFRVESPEPLYWKAQQLVDFDGTRWVTGSRRDLGENATDDLPADWTDRPGWNRSVRVALRRLRTETVVGPGTVLSVVGASRPVSEGLAPGQWVADGNRTLAQGDSYTVRSHVPEPTPQQLAAATVDAVPRPDAYLSVRTSYRADAMGRAPLLPAAPGRARRADVQAEVRFAPFGQGEDATALHRISGLATDGAATLRASHLDRTWGLARRLRDRATSPYDYLLAVNAHLRATRFEYSEVPRTVPGETPLETFLFDTRLGYCQHYAGAMALLLRMGGVPARVATGFSPGGFRETTGEWIVRDTDAHSWVEAWFDGLGWVAFDPTPSQTPARSLVAAIDPEPEPSGGGGSDAAQQGGSSPPARQPGGLTRDPVAATGAGADGGGLPVMLWPALAVALGGLVAAGLRLRAARRDAADPDGPLRELERALRRSGRETPAAMTLVQLERRLGAGTAGSAYLRALRAARYAAGAEAPSGAERAAFRRELAAGLGWTGRVRALWALPPRVYPVRRRPR